MTARGLINTDISKMFGLEFRATIRIIAGLKKTEYLSAEIKEIKYSQA